MIDSDDVDPFSDSELLETAGEYAGVGSDAALPEIDRFRAGVSRLVAKTRASHTASATPATRLGVLLLHPEGPPGELPSELSKECHRVPMLDQGREPLHGRVWFVTHVVVAGTWVPAEFTSDDELFTFVTETLKLGTVPAVVYDVGDPDPELRFYPGGLEEPESYEPLRIAYTDITVSAVFDRIDAVYRQLLVTPGAQPRGARLWEDARRGHVAGRAEELLGSLLAAALQAAFPTCRVRVEQPQPTGRLDLEIEEHLLGQPGVVRRHVVLELKVLRGLGSRGGIVNARAVRTWIADGVGQAAAYRDDRSALAGALCCFDMRLGGPTACFAHVVDTAAEVDVHLRSWYLFNSAGAYRRYLMETGALAARGTDGAQAG